MHHCRPSEMVTNLTEGLGPGALEYSGKALWRKMNFSWLLRDSRYFHRQSKLREFQMGKVTDRNRNGHGVTGVW